MCFGIVFFKFPITNSSRSLSLVAFEFRFGLILSFFENRNLSLYQNTIYNMAMNLNMPTNCLNNKL